MLGILFFFSVNFKFLAHSTILFFKVKMLAARHNTGWYEFIFTTVVFMKSIFYFTISYSSGVHHELFFQSAT